MANKVFANGREIACKAAGGKSVAAFPDVCFTPPLTPATPPGVPIPYPNTGLASDTSDGSSTVTISGKETMLKNKSCFSKTSGDEAGSAPKKGIVTSQIRGKAYFNAWSMDVKIEGENVDRHLDLTTHNHVSSMPGNTPPMVYADSMVMSFAGGESDCPVCPSMGSPVDPVLGAKVLSGDEDVDFLVDGPLVLEWQRSYLSINTRIGWFGQGWSSPLEIVLEDSPEGGIDYLDALGRRTRFPALAQGTQFYSPYEKTTLERDAQGRFSLSTADGLTYRFNAPDGGVYTLHAIEDRNDNVIVVELGETCGSVRIRCSGGRVLELRLDDRPRLLEIAEVHADERFTLVQYRYDAAGNLTHVYDRMGNCIREFGWRDHVMVKQVYAGTFEAFYEYTGAGTNAKVVKHWDNVGRMWTFRYGAETTEVIDQDGRLSLYHFDTKRRWTGYTDPLGRFTEYGLDRYGNLRANIGPADRITEIKYDERSHPVKLTDAMGATTEVVWHQTLDLPIAVIDPIGGSTRYVYDERGNRIAETAPGGAVTSYEYDSRGLVIGIEDANGGHKRLVYDAAGRLTSSTDCSNRTTRFGHDREGRLCEIINALGQSTRYEYDPLGRVTRQILAEGTSEEYVYDIAGRLITLTNALGAKTTYRYAPDGLLSERIDAQAGRFVYRYDSARRLIELQNENGARYHFAYDALDRLTAETRFDGTRIGYKYDAAGQLAETIEAVDSADEIRTTYLRDALGRLIERATAHGKSQYVYDAAGQLRSALNSKARVDLDYDAAGRLTREAVTTTQRTWVLRHEYDSLGNAIATTLPDGRKVAQLHYGSGHVHQIRLNERVISDLERDGLHREVARTQGALVTRKRYDAVGRLEWQVAEHAKSRGGSDVTSQVIPTPATHVERRYRYDGVGRLASANDRGRAIAYGYDVIDRLTRFDDERYSFDPAHNLVDSPGATGDNRLRVYEDKRYEYDAHGQVIEKRIGRHARIVLRWDDEHRLVESITTRHDEVVVTHYLYDALGRRLAKASQRDVRWYVWDGDRLLQECDGKAAHTFLYEPDSYVPLAIEVHAQNIKPVHETCFATYYYHCDQIGLPRELTDEEGNLAWEAQYKGWGRIKTARWHTIEPIASQSGRLVQPIQPLRYQGQYEDEETGLHYNRFRYYDPDMARFLSQDPIGLEGSENFYQYAPNPVHWVDPLGLVSKKCPICNDGSSGRSNKQARLRAMALDPNQPKWVRGWIRNELRHIASGSRKTIRLPGNSRESKNLPGKELAHGRQTEAKDGYCYLHSELQDADLHKTQHRIGGY